MSLFDLIGSVFPALAPTGRPVPVPVPRPAPASGGSGEPLHFTHVQAGHQIVLGDCRVGYLLKRAHRKSIGFVVGPDGLAVTAPRWVGQADIDAALHAKSGWILRKLAEQRDRQRRVQAHRVEWRDGGQLPYLGASLRLVLDAETTGVHLGVPAVGEGGELQQSLRVGWPPSARPEQVRDAVQAWLQHEARRIFEQRCAHFAPQVGVQVRRLRLSAAQTRWGSASADGSIRLNWRLIHFSLPVIDYVVVHELAHLREMNHSPAFWAVVASVLPDMAQRKALLRAPALPLLD